MKEDLKVLEKYINGKEMMKETLVQAIENLIARYKELEEKNQDLKCNYYNMAEQKLKLVKENINLNDELQMTKNSIKIANLDVMKDYIPKSKVRDLIQDIDETIYITKDDEVKFYMLGFKNSINELLEERN